MINSLHLSENISIAESLTMLPPDVESIAIDLDKPGVNAGELLKSPINIKFFDLVLQEIPYNHLPRYTTFGLICYAAGQQDIAMQFFAKQLRQDAKHRHGYQDSTALCYIAKQKMQKNQNHEEAEGLLQEAEKHGHDNVLVHLSLISLSMHQMQAERALTIFNKLRKLLTQEQFIKVVTRCFSESILKFLQAVIVNVPTEHIDDKNCSICTEDLSNQPNTVMAVKPSVKNDQQHYQPYHSCCLFTWLSSPGHDSDPNTNLPIDEIVLVSKII